MTTPIYQEDDSYTTLGEVKNRVQRGQKSGGSIPTKDETLIFMANRAGLITGQAKAVGLSFTVPSGTSPVTDSDLAKILSMVNALWAAGDVIAASGVRADSGDEVPETAKEYWEEAEALLEVAISIALRIGEGGVVPQSSVREATSTGGIERADYAPAGLHQERDRREMWNLDTDN